jgi:hypothetical protein
LPPLPRANSFWGATVALLSALLAVSSLLTIRGLPNTSDGALHLFRALELRWVWDQGALYSRWAPHFAHGLGYPIFNYVPPLTGFLTAGLSLFGLDMQDALKLVATGTVLAGALGTYLVARRFLAAPAAAVAGAAYALAPYRLYELYIQGNYPQLLAMGIAPFCLLGLARLSSRVDRLGFLILALSTATLALAHNISAVMLAPVLVGYGLWQLRSPRHPHLVPLLLAVTAGILAAAFFWLPAIGERDLVQIWRLTQGFFDFRQYFLSLEEILAFPQVLDFRASNPYFPFSLGGQLVLLAIPSLAYFGRVHDRNTRKRTDENPTHNTAIVTPQAGTRTRGHVIFLWAALLGYVWLMLPGSEGVWERVPPLAYLEFPHRLLGVASLPLALLVGASVQAVQDSAPWARRVCFLAAMAVVLLGAAPYVFPRQPFVDWSGLEAQDVQDFEARTGALGTTSAGEYCPRWVTEHPNPQVATAAKLAANLVELGPSRIRLEVSAQTAGPVTLPLLYFPGWQARVDGSPVPIEPTEPYGLAQVLLTSPGEHGIELELRPTPLQRRSHLVSLAGLVLVPLGLIVSRQRVRMPASAARSAQTMEAPRLGLAACALGVLVVGKAAYLEPHTSLFRQESPPGTVIGAQHPREIIFAGKIALLGYDLERNLPPQGESLNVTLYWQPMGRQSEDYHVFVHLVSLTDGQVIVRSEKAAPGELPTSIWHPALYVEDRHRLELPEHLPAVRYGLRVGLYDPRAQTALPAPDGQMSALLQEVQVVYNEPLDIRRFPGDGWYGFGQEVRLIGYALDRTELAAGESAHLTLFWRAEGPVEERMKRFVHLVNQAGIIVAQWDEWPVGGAYPTDLWLPQHNIADQVTVMVPASAGPGEYTLVVGLYDSTTLARPPVHRRGSERIPDDAVTLPPVIRVSG